jgi:hypothetical protein
MRRSLVLLQIVNTDGSNLDPDTDVGPVSLWMHSLFSDVCVSLSEKLVSPPTSMQEFWCTRAIFNRRCLSMCSVASSDDVWAFSALQLVL